MEPAQQRRTSGFVVCVDNEGHELDLELRKVYEVIPDESLEPEDIRVIDESGEDYIYPAQYFSTTEAMGESADAKSVQSDIERQARGFIEEHKSLLNEGSTTVLGRVFVQGTNIFTSLNAEVIEASNHAVSTRNALADAIRNPTTPASRLQELEVEEARASDIYARRAATSQELSDFLERVRELLPEGGASEDY